MLYRDKNSREICFENNWGVAHSAADLSSYIHLGPLAGTPTAPKYYIPLHTELPLKYATQWRDPNHSRQYIGRPCSLRELAAVWGTDDGG